MKHRVGLIGYGAMGKNHARIINSIKECELIGVYDNNIQNSDKDIVFHETLDSLIDSCEIIIISTPTNTHVDLLKLCIEKKKNVLIEKPLSNNLSEINEVKNLIKDSSNFYLIGLLEKFNPTVKFLKLENLNNIQNITVRRLSPLNQTNRNEDNVLLDLTIHDFSILKELLGLDLDKLNFEFFFKEDSESNHVDIFGKYKKSNIVITTSKIYQKKVRSIELLTTKKLYVCNLIQNSVEIISNDEISMISKNKNYGHIENSQISYPVIQNVEPLLSQFRYFLEDIETNDCKNNHKLFLEDISMHEYLINKI